MESTAIVLSTSDISYKGYEIKAGVEKEVPLNIARGLGSSIKIIKMIEAKEVKTADIKKVLEKKQIKGARNTAMTGKEKKVRIK